MAFDSKSALNHAIKYLTDAAYKRAAGGWIPPKEEEKRKKEAAKSEEKHQKLLSKQFPTHYMPEVGRQVMADGGTPEDQYDLGKQLQRGAEILGGTAKAQYERYGEPIVTGIQELMRPVYEGGTQESYTNPEMVGRAMDVVGGLGAGSMLTGPAAAETNVLRSGMGPVAKEVIAQPQRTLSPMGFYSPAAERAAQLQPKGDAAQFIAALKNTTGIKAEELMNAGLIDAQGNIHPEWASRGKLSREDVVSYLQSQMPQIEERVLGGDTSKIKQLKDKISGMAENDPRLFKLEQELLYEQTNAGTKYKTYTLPGSENYREVLLKYAESPEQKLERAKSLVDPAAWARMTDEQKQQFLSYPDKGIFKSQHWDDPNVLAHIRMADRTGPNGEKILHVEELQSDWGQKGKKEGFQDYPYTENDVWAKFVGPNVPEGHDPSNYPGYWETFSRRNGDLISRHRGNMDEPAALAEGAKAANLNNQNLTPSAPYVTSTEGWTDLALKRVLKEAAEGGYDKIVWTPGAEQAKRYDLSKHIDHLEYHPETKSLIGVKNNQVIMNKSVAPENIEDYVGKDVAKNLLSQPLGGQDLSVGGFHALSGQDLSVGGEGMKGYYDKIVPSRLQALAKKHDPNVKIGSHDVVQDWRASSIGADGVERDYASRPNRDQLLQYLRGDTTGLNIKPNTMSLPSLDVTPQMRESILRGQSAYKRGGAVEAYANGGSIGIGGMAAFGDPSEGPETYGVTTPMESRGDLLMNMSPEAREYLASEMTKQMNANEASTANSPMAAGIPYYDVEAEQRREDVMKSGQQAARDQVEPPKPTGMYNQPVDTTTFGTGIRDVDFPSAESPKLVKAPVTETSDTRARPKTVRQNFNQAFADALAAGLDRFTWTNPATGLTGVYTTKLKRKEGGRVPSLANHEDWEYKDEKEAPKKKSTKSTPDRNGSAIVSRALMLSSRKS